MRYGNMVNMPNNGSCLDQIMSSEEIDSDLELIIYNGARCLNIQVKYRLDVDKGDNFIVIDVGSTSDVIINRADVLTSIRKCEYLVKQKPLEYDVELGLGVDY